MIEFTKLSEVPSVEEIPEGASVLIETENEIRRAPADGMGGGPYIYYNVKAKVVDDGAVVTGGDLPRVDDLVVALSRGLFPIVNLETDISEGQKMLTSSIRCDLIANEETKAASFTGTFNIILVDDGTSSHWEITT